MIARAGIPYVLVAGIAALLFLLPAISLGSSWLAAGTVVCGLLTVLLLLFFRDPNRRITATTGQLLAPADGRIVGIERLRDAPHLNGNAIRISIFLSLFDVHIIRAPAAGTVDYVTHRSGRFLPGFRRRASDLNEQTEIGLTLADGNRVVVRLIAGMLARRIVCYARDDQHLQAGDKIGMIRFGSRVDLIVSPEFELRVSRGRHVLAGLTTISTLPGNSYRLNADDRQKHVEL